LLVAGVITISETDRLVTGRAELAGVSRSVTDVIGTVASGGTGAWSDWLLTEDLCHSVAMWILLQALFDIAWAGSP